MSRSQLFNFMQDSYLDRTSRPVYALVFLLPLIIFYEIGTMIISPEFFTALASGPEVRVVSFVWVQNLLEYLGFSSRATWIIVPLVVVVILLAMQITSRARWYVRLKDFLPMIIECVLLAIPLIVLSLMVNRSVSEDKSQYLAANVCNRLSVTAVTAVAAPEVSVDETEATDKASAAVVGDKGLMVNIVTGIGAGIYEELVFRLILICLLMIFFQDLLHVSGGSSVLLSVVISAILFSAHHHFYFIDGRFAVAEFFSPGKFFFRFLAGIYFSFIFAVRGFGITAGTHAVYDIIAAFMNAFLFDGGAIE